MDRELAIRIDSRATTIKANVYLLMTELSGAIHGDRRSELCHEAAMIFADLYELSTILWDLFPGIMPKELISPLSQGDVCE